MSNLRKSSKNHRNRRSFLMIFIFLLAIILCYFIGSFGYQRYMNESYPKKYADFVEHYAMEYNLEEEFVYAVIKCESGFDPNAISPIGARGLMQITEETFDWIKFRMNDSNEENTTYADLFDPEKNIHYGTFLLRLLMDDFGEDPVKTLAAYHAGRTRVFTWLEDPSYSLDGETLLHIPFDDTRTYVERVQKAEQIYYDLY